MQVPVDMYTIKSIVVRTFCRAELVGSLIPCFEDFTDPDGCLAGRDISVTSLGLIACKGEESHTFSLRVHSKP